jgi:hypothetical protein
MGMSLKTIKLSEDEQRVLELALEFYIRLGLGQFSEIAQRYDLLRPHLDPERLARLRQLAENMEDVCWQDAEPWHLTDEGTSLHTLIAFGLEARLAGNTKGQRWAQRRIKDRAVFEKIDYREA